MIIKNKTKKNIVNKNTVMCNEIISKFLGLMFSKKQNKALILKFENEKSISLHMFFVFHPIDVIFLDKDNIVVDIKETFRPFTFYKSRENAMYAIEIPQGNIKKTKTEIGDKIEFG